MASFDSGSFSTTHFASSSFDLEAGVSAAASITAQASAVGTAYADRRVEAVVSATASFTGNVVFDAAVEIRSGATWKHLWNPVREVAIDPVKIERRSTRVNVLPPETPVPLSIAADTLPERVSVSHRVGVELPTTGVMPPINRVLASSSVKIKRPKAHANTPFVRAVRQVRANKLPPIPTVTVMPVSIRGKTHYAYWTPETVQNPTEEMLHIL